MQITSMVSQFASEALQLQEIREFLVMSPAVGR
jgi:hypothetical protein